MLCSRSAFAISACQGTANLGTYTSLVRWDGYPFDTHADTAHELQKQRYIAPRTLFPPVYGGCMIEGIRAAKVFDDNNCSWRKYTLATTVLLVPDAWSVNVTIFS